MTGGDVAAIGGHRHRFHGTLLGRVLFGDTPAVSCVEYFDTPGTRDREQPLAGRVEGKRRDGAAQ